MKLKIIFITIIAFGLGVLTFATQSPQNHMLDKYESEAWVMNMNANMYAQINLPSKEVVATRKIASNNKLLNGQIVNGYYISGNQYLKLSSSTPVDISQAILAETEQLDQVPQQFIRIESCKAQFDGMIMLAWSGDISFATSQSFADLKPILHPFGQMLAVDAFCQENSEVIVVAYTKMRQLVLFNATTGQLLESVDNVGPSEYDIQSDTFQVGITSDTLILLWNSADASQVELWSNDSLIKQFNQPVALKTVIEPTCQVLDRRDCQRNGLLELYLSSSATIMKFCNNQLETVYQIEKTAQLNKVDAVINSDDLLRPWGMRNYRNSVTNEVVTIFEGISQVIVVQCIAYSNQCYSHKLEHSATVGVTSGLAFNRNLNFEVVGAYLVINARATGQTWVYSDEWKVVTYTVGDWNISSVQNNQGTNYQDASSNLCPVPPSPNEAVFGARPSRDTLLQVLLDVQDPNPEDSLRISELISESQSAIGTVRIVNNGAALALMAQPDAKGSITITVQVTDGGIDTSSSGNSGICQVLMNFTVEIHPYSMPNQPPIQRGAPLNSQYFIAGQYPSISTVNLLDNWIDPDGDPISMKISSTSCPTYRVKCLINDKSQLIFQAQQLEFDTQEVVHLTIFDQFGAQTNVTTTFQVENSPPNPPLNLTLVAVAGNAVQYDIVPVITGVQPQAIRFRDVPSEVTATVKNNTTVNLNAQIPGNYWLTYSYNDSDLNGKIKLVVYPNSHKLYQSVAPITLQMMPFSDKILDLTHVISGQNITAIKVVDLQVLDTESMEFDNNVLGTNRDDSRCLQANIIEDQQLYIANFGISPTNTHQSNNNQCGQLLLTWQTDNQILTSEVAVHLSQVNLSTQTQVIPIVIGQPEWVTIQSGEIHDVNVLANAITNNGHLILDSAIVTDVQNNMSVVSFVYGDVVRIISSPFVSSPIAFSIEYQIYQLSNYSATLVTSHIYVEILPATSMQQTDKQIQSYATKLADSVTNPQLALYFDYANVNSTGSLEIRPFTNDQIPQCFQGRISVATIIASNRSDVQLGDEVAQIQFQPLADIINVVLGNKLTIGDQFIVEITADFIATCTVTYNGHLSGEGDIIFSSKELVNLYISDSKLTSEVPQIVDKLVQADEIDQRKHFAVDLTSQVLWKLGVEDLQFEIVTNLSTSNQQTSYELTDDKVIKGVLTEQYQLIVYCVTSMTERMENSDNHVSSYGILIAPHRSSIKPVRKNQFPKSVQAPDILQINLVDEVLPLADAQLTVDHHVQHSRMRPNSSCYVQNLTLMYNSGVTANDAEDKDTQDVCAVIVGWDNSPSATTVLTFAIIIVPQFVPPELPKQLQLGQLLPNTSQSYNLANHIKWFGHNMSDISKLNIKCTVDGANVGQIEVGCQGTTLQVVVVREAKELGVHQINLMLPEFPEQWGSCTIVISQTVKSQTLRIPEIVYVMIYEEQPTVVVPVDNQVRKLFDDTNYLGIFSGASVTCGVVDQRIGCQQGQEFGQLIISVVTSLETSFESTVQYQFTDRSEIENPNRGTGIIQISYYALPRCIYNSQIMSTDILCQPPCQYNELLLSTDVNCVPACEYNELLLSTDNDCQPPCIWDNTIISTNPDCQEPEPEPYPEPENPEPIPNPESPEFPEVSLDQTLTLPQIVLLE